MAYSPAGSEPFFRTVLPADVGLIEAVAPDFGTCLFKAIDGLLAQGHSAAVVLNSDSPTLPAAYLISAAVALSVDEDCAVIGPSADGGYYLLGLKTSHKLLFEEVDWSTERVFQQTLARCRDIGLPVSVLPMWYDVDDATSLTALRDELDGIATPFGALASPAHHARAAMMQVFPATAAFAAGRVA
jgi:hypothetical protein